MELFRCALAPTLEPPGGGGGSLDTTSRLLEAVLLSSKSTEILRVKDVSRIGGAHPPSMGEPDDLKHSDHVGDSSKESQSVLALLICELLFAGDVCTNNGGGLAMVKPERAGPQDGKRCGRYGVKDGNLCYGTYGGAPTCTSVRRWRGWVVARCLILSIDVGLICFFYLRGMGIRAALFKSWPLT